MLHATTYLRIKFANMQMTVFLAIRLPEETSDSFRHSHYAVSAVRYFWPRAISKT